MHLAARLCVDFVAEEMWFLLLSGGPETFTVAAGLSLPAYHYSDGAL